MIYGHDKTIHGTEKVNVELGPDGKVVSVWFRCAALPFDQTVVDQSRVNEMAKMYDSNNIKLRAVDIEYAETVGRTWKPIFQSARHVGFPRGD